MRKEEILRLIKETIAKTMLSGAKVILFGPQARGDAREDSDWDILILLNKDKVELDDHDYISYPFLNLDGLLTYKLIPFFILLRTGWKGVFHYFTRMWNERGLIYVKCRRRNSSAY